MYPHHLTMFNDRRYIQSMVFNIPIEISANPLVIFQLIHSSQFFSLIMGVISHV